MSKTPETGEPDEVSLYPKEYMDKVEQERTTLREIHTELNKVLNNLREKETQHPLKLDINVLTPEQKAFILKAPDPYRFLDISKDYLARIQMKQEYEVFILNRYKKQCKSKASEAVTALNQRGLGQTTGASLELIASDVLDHYRTYSLIEKLLSNPNKLQEQLEFQIEPQTRQLLIEKYYDFDDSVIRELLGKKLSSRNRKDLDEVSEKTGVPLKSCRRQFDNVKRVYKMVEELPGSVVQNIQKLFFLPTELARKYGCVVFLACIRFETSKRRLQYLKFASLQKCSEIIMESWAYTITGPEYYDTEMDKEFLLDLRELRVLMDREKEHKHLVCNLLKPKMLSRTWTELDNNFRTYSRAILTLAASIHRAREMRNFFVDVSQILDMWKQNGWATKDLELFLNAYSQCALDLDVLREVDLKDTWERFMKVLSQCILIMYN